MKHETLQYIDQGIETEFASENASTRRKFVGMATGAIGGLGLLAAVPASSLASVSTDNSLTNILNVAITAEALATIVNTVGPEKVALDRVTKGNVQAAARQELIHYETLQSLGAHPAATKIWVPDAAFASREGLLKTLVYGDQVFINAYLIGITAAAAGGQSTTARYAGEIMGVEAVHRALALQSLGELGNDRAFMDFEFTDIFAAVSKLQTAGFGFGAKGSKPGKFYDFNEVKNRTPNPSGVDTRKPV
jgi:hypothetical protein